MGKLQSYEGWLEQQVDVFLDTYEITFPQLVLTNKAFDKEDFDEVASQLYCEKIVARLEEEEDTARYEIIQDTYGGVSEMISDLITDKEFKKSGEHWVGMMEAVIAREWFPESV